MEKIFEAFRQLPTGNICDANGKAGNMDMAIKPLDPKCKLVGLAFTVKGHPGDNLAIHNAIYKAPKCSVLVVDMAGYCLGGHFGEIMATACMKQGIAGLVIDGTVRDANDIQELGFPVFCRGLNPGGTGKEYTGRTKDAVICGGVYVNTGDLIVGDRDGVVVVTGANIEKVCEGAQAIAQKEVKVLELLHTGETTLDIYRLKKAAE